MLGTELHKWSLIQLLHALCLVSGSGSTIPAMLPRDRVLHVWALLSLQVDHVVTCCVSAGPVGGFTAAQVEEVRMVMRMLPVFFTTILFWTIYCQASRPTS